MYELAVKFQQIKTNGLIFYSQKIKWKTVKLIVLKTLFDKISIEWSLYFLHYINGNTMIYVNKTNYIDF